MKSPTFTAAVLFMLSWPLSGLAAERTVTLNVDNMTCVSCLYMVRMTLERVDDVTRAEVDNRTATVTFDDRQTSVDQLIEATAGIGFPSRLKEE